MGGRQSVFQERDLEHYQECTYFTRDEIIALYKRFRHLNPRKISNRVADVSTRLSIEEVEHLPELKENPFKHRICAVFSTSEDGMNFEDVLDMFSVFSERAPWDLKATYAFRIYDFNEDSSICSSDIKNVIKCMTGNGVHQESELEAIAQGILNESSVAHDKLSYVEFEHVVARAPDFANLFHITI